MQGSKQGLCAVVAAVVLLLSSAAMAANLNVMAIGDSITLGFGYGAENNIGSWRVPLADLLADDLDATNTFSFIGSKTDTTGAHHEGYSGYAISPAAAGSKVVPGYISTSLGTDPGDINPTNADIVMLMIGTNGEKSGSAGQTAVNELGTLINTLINDYLSPNAILLVSTLTPEQENRRRGSAGFYDNSDADHLDSNHRSIDPFNQMILDTLFGGAWDTGAYASGTVAEHMSWGDRVLLVDANSAIDRSATEGLLLYDDSNDFLHLTPTGNLALADFYYDRFLEIGLIPTPSTGVIGVVLFGGAILTGRRSRRAA